MSASAVVSSYLSYVASAAGCVLPVLSGTFVTPPGAAAMLESCPNALFAQASLVNSLGCLAGAASGSDPDSCTIVNRILGAAGQPTMDDLSEVERYEIAQQARQLRLQLQEQWRQNLNELADHAQAIQSTRNAWLMLSVTLGFSAVALTGSAVYMALKREG